jgi:hypothetical protein
MRMPPNTIHGEAPQIFNARHIAFIKEKDRVLSGEINFHTIQWAHCQYSGSHNETNKPIFRYTSFKNSNAVVDYIPCPRCGRQHVLLVGYDPDDNWYDQLALIDETVEEFECWNCGIKFETDDDRNAYVSKNSYYE